MLAGGRETAECMCPPGLLTVTITGGGGGKLLDCTCVARLFSHNNINIQSVLSKLS